MINTSTMLYQIIKYRKHRTTIDYLDYERIIGYDFLTGSQSFENVIYKLNTSDEKNIKLIQFLENCIKNDEFVVEKPLTKLEKGKTFMSNRFNEIDDYITMNEINMLRKMKELSLDEFYEQSFYALGFNTNINNIFANNKIEKVRDLFYMEGLLTTIDPEIIKIVYTKVNTIRSQLYNIKTRNEEYIPIASVIDDKDYKTYNKLRKENVYTVADLKRYEKNVTRSRKY